MTKPFTQVPQGQVGTGTAYVHQYRDNTAAIQAMAEAARQKRVDEQKKLASLKDFNYGEVVDQTMAEEIRSEYKEGLDFFAKVFVNGGDPTNLSTEEGRMFSEFKQKIQDKAKQANSATARYNKYSDAVYNNPDVYDVDIWNALQDEYKNATTTDDKIKTLISLDPIYAKNFDFTKWVDNAVEDVAKDVLIENQTKDQTKYLEDYNTKLDGIPLELAGTPQYDIAKIKWQKKKDEGDPDFQQVDFETFLQERVKAEGDRRLKTREAARGSITVNANMNLPGQTTPGGGIVTTTNTGAKQAMVYLYNDANNKNLVRQADGTIKLPAPSTNLKDVQGGVDNDLDVFTIIGNDVYVNPVQYAKEYHYVGGKEYAVGSDPKYKNLDINLRKYNSSQTQNSAKLTTVWYDQGGNLWSQSTEGGFFLLAPRDSNSPLYDEVSAELNAKAVLTTFFGIKDANAKSKDKVFQLIKSNFSLQ